MKYERTSRDVFVGREREMAELVSALDDAIAGSGRIVMLVGEPGIGKTRTAEELAAIAARKGVEVLWGRCPEDPGAPPFWPWAQAIRTHTEQLENDRLQEEIAGRAVYVAQIVPEVASRTTNATAQPAVDDPEQARFVVFDGVTSFFKRASSARPLLIVLDNLHWADGSSLRFLEFIAPEISSSRMLILGTYRDVDIARGHSLFHTLGELTRQRLFQRVVLRGLGATEIRSIIAAAGTDNPPAQLVDQLQAHTEGNPFFVRELVTLLRDEGLLTAARLAELKSWNFRLPEGVREVVGRRLDRLSQQCNVVLGVASVIGREFDAGLLGRLVVAVPSDAAGGRGEDSGQDQAERPPLGFQVQRGEVPSHRPAGAPGGSPDASSTLRTSAALAVLEEALESHIVEDAPGLPGHYRFTHALIQRTMREEIPTARRVRVHAQIASTLEHIYGDRSDDHAAELAGHFVEAEPLLGAEKAVHYSMLAGAQANAAYAFEDGLEHFQRAEAALLAGNGPADERRLADILAGQSHSLTRTLLDRKARQRHWDILTRAFDLYLKTGETSKAVELANEQVAFSGLKGTVSVTERALHLVPPESEQAGWIWARYGIALMDETGDFPGAHAAFEHAFAIGEKLGNARLMARALAHRTQCDVAENNHGVAIKRGLSAIGLAREAQDPLSEVRVPGFIATSMAALGEPGNAEAVVTSNIALARSSRWPHHVLGGLFALCLIARLRGDWSALHRHKEELRGVGSVREAADWLTAVETCDRGPVSDGLNALGGAIEQASATGWAVQQFWGGLLLVGATAAATFAFGQQVHQDKAKAAADEILHLSPRQPRYVHAGEHGLAFVAIARRDTAEAAGLYPAILGRAGTVDAYGGFSVDRLLGLLAVTSGNQQAAAAHFENAIAFCRKAGYRPELARTSHDYAEMLISAGATADRQKISSLIEQGQAIVEELDMKPLAGKLDVLRDKLALRRGGRPEYPDGLTEREVEVLRLIAAGRSNAEIAEALVITPNTAAKHVANILTKINASNRAEAASYAHRHGLMEDNPR